MNKTSRDSNHVWTNVPQKKKSVKMRLMTSQARVFLMDLTVKHAKDAGVTLSMRARARVCVPKHAPLVSTAALRAPAEAP